MLQTEALVLQSEQTYCSATLFLASGTLRSVCRPLPTLPVRAGHLWGKPRPQAPISPPTPPAQCQELTSAGQGRICTAFLSRDSHETFQWTSSCLPVGMHTGVPPSRPHVDGGVYRGNTHPGTGTSVPSHPHSAPRLLCLLSFTPVASPERGRTNHGVHLHTLVKQHSRAVVMHSTLQERALAHLQRVLTSH